MGVRRLLKLVPVWVVIGACSALPRAAAADEVLAEGGYYASLAASPTRLAWMEPENGRLVLFTRAGGKIERLPVPPLTVPTGIPLDAAFSADFGLDDRGHEVLAYTRCTAGGQCAMYRFDFVTDRETLIRASRRSGSEALPSISGKRVAYYSVTKSGRERLYWSRLRGKARHRLPTSCASRGQTGGPLRLDLSGRQLAATWQCWDGNQQTYQVQLTRIGGRRAQLIDSTTHCYSGSCPELYSPSIVGRAVYYGYDPDDYGFPPGPLLRIRRYDILTRRLTQALHTPEPRIQNLAGHSLAVTAAHTYYRGEYHPQTIPENMSGYTQLRDAGVLTFR